MDQPPEKDRVGRHVFFSGLVQGVGFRYATVRLAADYAVAGSVRNLPDGRVEIVAEGERAEVERFLDAVRRRMGRYIRAEEKNEYPPRGSYRGFTVS